MRGLRRLASVTMCGWIWAGTAHAQVIEAEHLTTTAFRALDRARTAVIIPGGILEEHGPYLPSGSDTYQARWLADALARRIASRPGWTALMLPMVPLGHSGANDIAREWVYPSTLTIRASTLRAVYMDLADALGEQGFRYIFLVHVHGAPLHNQMLDQAAAYFTETWGGTMVHLMGLQVVNARDSDPLSSAPQAARNADGFTVHAGLSESSRVMFVRPDLVPQSIANAPPVTARDFSDLEARSKSPAWRGYWGAPAASSVSLGAALLENTAAQIGAVADAVLDGRPWPSDPFFTETNMDPADRVISRETEAREASLTRRQQTWIENRKRP